MQLDDLVAASRAQGMDPRVLDSLVTAYILGARQVAVGMGSRALASELLDFGQYVSDQGWTFARSHTSAYSTQ